VVAGDDAADAGLTKRKPRLELDARARDEPSAWIPQLPIFSRRSPGPPARREAGMDKDDGPPTGASHGLEEPVTSPGKRSTTV
jgi:hypothetical protein